MIDIIRVTAGALLHDIGKVVQRAGGVSGTHSEIGLKFLKELAITDKDVLDCVSYHHARELNLAKNASPYAYIAYIADNIAAQERRTAQEEHSQSGWDAKTPLQSVFNLMGKDSKRHYVGVVGGRVIVCPLRYKPRKRRGFIPL